MVYSVFPGWCLTTYQINYIINNISKQLENLYRKAFLKNPNFHMIKFFY